MTAYMYCPVCCQIETNGCSLKKISIKHKQYINLGDINYAGKGIRNLQYFKQAGSVEMEARGSVIKLPLVVDIKLTESDHMATSLIIITC